MAVVTIAYSGVMFTFFEVANKAGAISNCNVFTLNNLGMAARAAESFASFQISKVNFVIKGNFFIFRHSFQEPLFVTTFPKTTFVRNFSPRF